MFILFPAPDKGTEFSGVSNELYLKRVKEFVGDDSIPVEGMSADALSHSNEPTQSALPHCLTRTNQIPSSQRL